MLAYPQSQGRPIQADQLTLTVNAGDERLSFIQPGGHWISLSPLHGTEHSAWYVEAAHREHRHAWEYDPHGDMPGR